jgi:hypothetical protein
MAYADPIVWIDPSSWDSPERRADFMRAGYLGQGWYFWCEAGTACMGPYPTKDAARIGLEKYAAWLDRRR